MQIQINTGHNIEGHEALATHFTGVVEDSLSRFGDRLTNVDVHLSNENSEQQDGNDSMRCMIEAHISGYQALAVTHQAETLDQAVDGAAEKLTHLVENTLGKLEHQSNHRTDPPLSRSVNS